MGNNVHAVYQSIQPNTNWSSKQHSTTKATMNDRIPTEANPAASLSSDGDVTLIERALPEVLTIAEGSDLSLGAEVISPDGGTHQLPFNI
jgi:hypothetical protein